MNKKITLILLWLLWLCLFVFWVDILTEYLAKHEYYGTMMNFSNISLVIGSIIFAMIPVWYVVYKKKFSLKFFIMFVWLALALFGISHVSKFGGFVWSGFLIYLVNISILFWLAIYFILWLQSLWGLISRLVFKFKEFWLNQVLLNFGLWLVIFLLFNYILIGFWLFFPVVSWIIFLCFGFLIWWESKRSLKKSSGIISNIFSKLQIRNLKWKRYMRFFIILLCLSLAYYFYGLNLSFIPYPTAWDANHEYMYIPKVIAEYSGVIRWNLGVADNMPYLRHSFITFWFSLFGDWFWLSEDTIAISMNFLSGIFVLLLSLWLISVVLRFFGKEEWTEYNVWMIVGWLVVLLWLTSGMWAFLVFVDNKTDLWVMALTVLAIISGFMVLNQVKDKKLENKNLKNEKNNDSKKLETEEKTKKETDYQNDNWKYLVLSGLFFSAWIMAKPTAFIDIAIFAILVSIVWFNGILWLWLGFVLTWLMWILKPLKASLFISPELGKLLMMIGGWLMIIWIIIVFLDYKNIKLKLQHLKHILIWGLSLFIFVLVFKGSWLAYDLSIRENLNIWTFSKWLLTQADNWTGGNLDDILLLNSMDSEQEEIPTLQQCNTIEYSESELYDNLQEFWWAVNDDDFWRYVWYGWFEMKTNSLGAKIIKMFYPKNNTCYWLNSDAKVLCNNQTAISIYDENVLKTIETELKEDWDVKIILEETFDYADELRENGSVVNSNSMADYILKLEEYYKDHSIYTQANAINIPYRYIIPLNIVFNWSLQNRSSYYTDIGFVWLIFMWLVAVWWIVSLFKKDCKFFALTTATIFGWVIWWLIASAIVWYGIGLITWTWLVLIWLFDKLFDWAFEEKNKNYKIMLWIVFGIFIFWSSFQLVLNFVRMSSQWASWPFIWYKQSVWTQQTITEELQVSNEIDLGYSAQDVFNLQFGHYWVTMDTLQDRNEEDWVYVAGTYLPYFLEKQKNIRYDNMLWFMYKMSSDQDVCKTYQRLQENKIKYIVFDPNIWTVVVGDGNQGLFDRFLAKFSAVDWNIEEHWALSMLIELKENGYLDYVSSNNIWTKYGFESTDEELRAFLETMRWWGNVSQWDVDKFRLELVASRFFLNENSELWSYILTRFNNRMQNGQALSDLADMFWRQVDLDVIDAFFIAYANQNQQAVLDIVENANQNERYVILNYMNMLSLSASNPEQYSTSLNDIILKSLSSGSQIIFLELK